MITLSQEQKELFAYIDSLIPGEGHLQYDFRDKKQYAFARLMATLSGNAEKYPGMLKSIELIKEFQKKNGVPKDEFQSSDGWQNMFTIPGLNLTKDSTIASNGLATVVGGYSSMNLSLIVQSRKSKNIVAHGFNNSFSQALLTVSTAPSTSKEIDVNSYLHYQYTTSGSELASPYSGVVKRKDNGGTTGDPMITAPVRTTSNPKNPNAINIGLGRPWTDQGGNSQFDYAWNESTQDHPVGKIPFVGSVTFAKPISSPLEFNTNFLLNIYVADETGGGGTQLAPADLNKVASAFSIDSINSAKLNWNLPPGQSTSDPGNPIVFSNVTWNSDILAYFFCEIDIVLSDSSLATAIVQSSTSPDTDPLDGTLNIMPIDFIWHCLAEKTLVIMADGSKRVIEDIIAGDKVQINDRGDVAIVEWTNKGSHKGLVLNIETETGKKILASHNHVFITGKDATPALELKTGDILKMISGNEKIKSIEISEYNDLVYNIATVKYQDTQSPNPKMGTFYANDFLVGDINAQRVIKMLRLNDINWIKKQVPQYLHADVETFFKEKTK